MKPNPCKRCGKEPIAGKSNAGVVFAVCPCCTGPHILEDWNAMNPERASDCPVESQEPVEQTCGNCRFYNDHECWRNPPTRFSENATGFPFVGAKQWCGEWRAK